MWRLVRRLSKRGLIFEAMSRSIGQNYVYNIGLDYFLKERAKAHWFCIWKLLPGKYVDIQMERDRMLMQRAHALNYVEIVDLKEKGGVRIHALDEGYLFSKPLAGFSEYLKKDKEAWLTIIAICSAIWSVSFFKTPREFIQNEWYTFTHHEQRQEKVSTSTAQSYILLNIASKTNKSR